MNAYQPTGIRVPPHSIEAEQAVLGGLLLHPAAFFELVDLAEDDFYRIDHRLIWRAISGLAEDDSPVDVLTVSRAIEHAGASGRGVELAYVAELLDAAPSVSNVRAYSEIVRECAALRGVITAANNMADAALDPEGRKAAEIVSDAQSAVLELSSETSSNAEHNMRDLLKEVVDELDAKVAGVETGLRVGRRDFDSRHQGFEEQELIILAGRPSMAKTTVAMDWALNIAEGGGRVHVFSLEMSGKALMRRMASRISGIPSHVLRSAQLGKEDWSRMTTAMSRLRDVPLTVDDTGGLHINQVRARARARHMRTPLSLIVVDYLQLMRGDGRSQLEEVTRISQGLKALAKELRIPVVALSQLSRSCESRTDKRPLMSDLRESGAIEQDADRIVMCYRHEYYDDKTPRKGVLELITRKFREGDVGTDYLCADLSRSTLTDVPEGWECPPETLPQPKRFDGKDL